MVGVLCLRGITLGKGTLRTYPSLRVPTFRHGMEKAVNKDSGEAVSDLAKSKGINIDVGDSQSLFSLVRRVRESSLGLVVEPVLNGAVDPGSRPRLRSKCQKTWV